METPSSQSTALGLLGRHPSLLASDGHRGRQHSGLDPGSSSFPGSQEAGAERPAAGGSSASLRLPAAPSVGTALTALCNSPWRGESPSCPARSRSRSGKEQERKGAERSRERLRQRLQRAWGMDAICWNCSAAAAAAPAAPATAPSSPPPPRAQAPRSTPDHACCTAWRVCSPRGRGAPSSPHALDPALAAGRRGSIEPASWEWPARCQYCPLYTPAPSCRAPGPRPSETGREETAAR